MTDYSALKKRVKRHVIAPLHTFFASTSPGLETLCEKELCSLFPTMKTLSIEQGGVKFKGKLKDCYEANLNLRIPGRILMRIKKFRATNFRKLQKILSEFPWELYLRENVIPEIKTTTTHSRLYHKDAIAERFINSIKRRFEKYSFLPPISDNNTHHQQIFVRAINDHFTVSVDCSGELLYKRGIKRHRGKAPIRETMAAAALIKADYNTGAPLLDPMCGTGTFSIEAGMISNNIPPGWYRKFAFENWPGFRPQTWQYIKRSAGARIKTKKGQPNIISCDSDKNTCLAVKNSIKKYPLNYNIEVLNKSFFEITPLDIHKYTNLEKKGLVIMNPPYGIRLGTKKESKKLNYRISNRLKKYFQGWKVALFIHDERLLDIKLNNYNSMTIDHGGLKLTLITGIVIG